VKGLAATFFMFFACLAPAVAFGGLMGKATDGHVRHRKSHASASAVSVPYHNQCHLGELFSP
jgi:hypothetical protein